MEYGITGRRALVTGGDSGIGLATARLLAEEGALVALTDVDQGRLDEAAHGLPGEVVTMAADLTRAADVQVLRDRVVDELGDPEIVVHAAGVTGATGDFLESDDAGWEQTLQTDLMSGVRVLRTFLPAMRDAGWGRVVLLASEDAEQPYPDELPYCAAKAAVLSLVKGVSKAYGSDGLTVNAVSPAFVETPMTDAMMQQRAEQSGTDVEEAVRTFLSQQRPLMTAGRRGRPEEVAAVIAFLCSESASFVNGSNYRVDSGSVATI